MYSPVCDFSGSSTKCWISAHTGSCGHGYRLCVLCTVGLPVPKYVSGIARLLCLTVPDCSHRARLQELTVCVCFPKLSLLGVPLGEVGPELSQVPGGVPCPDSCASGATVCLCLWGHASTDSSSGPAGSWLWTVQAAPREPRVQLGARGSPGPAVLPCRASLVASLSHQVPLWVLISGYRWCSAVSHICTIHLC